MESGSGHSFPPWRGRCEPAPIPELYSGSPRAALPQGIAAGAVGVVGPSPKFDMSDDGRHFSTSRPPLHAWDLTPAQAVQLQRDLRKRLPAGTVVKNPRRLAGADAAYLPKTGTTIAAVVVLSWPEFHLVESARVPIATGFPYLPGLLSFREAPALLQAFARLSELPDLVFVDGHGKAHPRRFGIACHLGLWLQVPTVGIGKSRLCGVFSEPGPERGCRTDLTLDHEVIGQVVRSRPSVKPIFVSEGYGLELRDCVDWTLRACPRFRLPEPIRRAHRLATHGV